MLQRSLTFALCLSLASLAPLPMLACALAAGLPADCQPQPHCLAMGMTVPVTSLEAGFDSSCCELSAAPLPQAHAKAYAPGVAAEGVRDPRSVTRDAQPAHASAPNPLERVSTADRQPFLCVLLI